MARTRDLVTYLKSHVGVSRVGYYYSAAAQADESQSEVTYRATGSYYTWGVDASTIDNGVLDPMSGRDAARKLDCIEACDDKQENALHFLLSNRLYPEFYEHKPIDDRDFIIPSHSDESDEAVNASAKNATHVVAKRQSASWLSAENAKHVRINKQLLTLPRVMTEHASVLKVILSQYQQEQARLMRSLKKPNQQGQNPVQIAYQQLPSERVLKPLHEIMREQKDADKEYFYQRVVHLCASRWESFFVDVYGQEVVRSSLSVADEWGDRPLHWLAKSHVMTMQKVQQLNALFPADSEEKVAEDVEAFLPGQQGLNPFHLVCLRKKDHHASIEHEGDDEQMLQTFLTILARLSLHTLYRRLKDRDSQGRTPLLIAIELRQLGMVRAIINAVADKEELTSIAAVADRKGFSAIHYAYLSGDEELLKYVVDEIPGPSRKQQKKDLYLGVGTEPRLTLAHIFADKLTSFRTEKYRKSALRDALVIQDVQGNTPLHLLASSTVAPREKIQEIKQLMAHRKTTPESIQRAFCANYSGRNPLHYMCKQFVYHLDERDYADDAEAVATLKEFLQLFPRQQVQVQRPTSVRVESRCPLLVEKLKENTQGQDTPFMMLVRSGNEIALRAVIESLGNDNEQALSVIAATPNVAGPEGYTALHYACQYGNKAILKMVVDALGSDNVRAIRKQFPRLAELVTQNSRLQLADYYELVAHNHPLARVDKDGNNPLHLACNEFNAANALFLQVELRIRSLKSPQIQHNDSEHNARSTRAVQKVENICAQIVEDKYAPPAEELFLPNKKGQTPLHLAEATIFHFVFDTAKKMLSKDYLSQKILSFGDVAGKTPLLSSVEKGDTLAVEELVNYSPSLINGRDNWGFTSLDYSGQRQFVRRLLLSAQLPPKSFDPVQQRISTFHDLSLEEQKKAGLESLVHMRQQKQSAAVADDLQENKSEAMDIDEDRRGWFHEACRENNSAVIQAACQVLRHISQHVHTAAKAQQEAERVFAPNDQGQNPLHLVAKFGNFHNASAVFAALPDNFLSRKVQEPDEDDVSPVEYAILSGDAPKADLFLQTLIGAMRLDSGPSVKRATDKTEKERERHQHLLKQFMVGSLTEERWLYADAKVQKPRSALQFAFDSQNPALLKALRDALDVVLNGHGMADTIIAEQCQQRKNIFLERYQQLCDEQTHGSRFNLRVTDFAQCILDAKVGVLPKRVEDSNFLSYRSQIVFLGSGEINPLRNRHYQFRVDLRKQNGMLQRELNKLIDRIVEDLKAKKLSGVLAEEMKYIVWSVKRPDRGDKAGLYDLIASAADLHPNPKTSGSKTPHR